MYCTNIGFFAYSNVQIYQSAEFTPIFETIQLKLIHSTIEKIIEIAEVTKVGLDVFGNVEKLKLWLDTPSYALGKLKPIKLLKDSYGIFV